MKSLLRSEALRSIAPLVVAIVVISLYTNGKNSNFLTASNIETILVQASVLGVIAIGQTFLIAAGLMDLSVGTQAAMVGVIAATMVNDGHSEAVAVITVLVVSAVVGMVWGAMVAGLRIPPFILTLGGASLFSSLALRISKSSPVPVRGHFRWLGNSEILGLKTPVVVLLVTLALAAFVMRYTRFGRNVYAVGSAEEAAYLAGLPAARTKVLCFVVSSTLAGVGGLIGMARISTGDPRVGGQLALQAIAAVVLGGATLAGGRGTPIGTAVGVLLLQVVSAALTFNNVKTYWNEAVFGGVLIVAVVITAIGDLRRRSSGPPRLLRLLTRSGGSPPAPPSTPPPAATRDPVAALIPELSPPAPATTQPDPPSPLSSQEEP